MTATAIGIDVGTSGVRAVVMSAKQTLVTQSAVRFAEIGENGRDPALWWNAVTKALGACVGEIDGGRIVAISVDGTSGTVLPVDESGTPLAAPLMYNDRVEDAGFAERISCVAPPESAAHGSGSGLAKMLALQSVPGVKRMLHQADWIAGRLAGRFEFTDENNALKSGYDPVSGTWPDWIGDLGLPAELLPRVLAPGAIAGQIHADRARQLGISPKAIIVAGTTDGCASFLATGAGRLGDGVTVLGSTITLKLLCQKPICAPAFGVYSHRILGMWLAGGASNSGGKVLERFFARERLEQLSNEIDPQTACDLDYYPLLQPGERFPVSDPGLMPRLSPRPDSDALFLKGLLKGMATIEAEGYRLLEKLGAPSLRAVRTVGGGAGNNAWSQMRQLRLGVPFLPADSTEAAAGSAKLALIGARAANQPG